MKGKCQWTLSLDIDCPKKRLWESLDDVTLIPKYHPEVGQVTLLSGQSKRALGVKYQCIILEGRKGSCVEEVVEYIPYEKVSTGMGEDTWGMDKIISDLVVDTTLSSKDEKTTTLRFEAYYNPIGIFYRLFNVLVLRRLMKQRSLLVMKGIKRFAENMSTQ